MLDHPSLAERLPNGLIGVNDDYRHRVVLIDPKTKRIVSRASLKRPSAAPTKRAYGLRKPRASARRKRLRADTLKKKPPVSLLKRRPRVSMPKKWRSSASRKR